MLGGQRHAILEQAPSERRGPLDEAIHAAFASGLNRALVVAGLIGIAGAIVVALTVRTPAPSPPPAAAPESEREPVPA